MRWDDEAVAKLKKLWSEGLSAGQIAMRISMTRNAVIGKVHRLGLASRDTSSARVRSRMATSNRRKRESRSAQPVRKEPPSAKLFAADASVPPVEELVIPLAERKTIQTLTESSCRWPIGDPQAADFHFCGKTKASPLPYCEFHARRAYQPVVPQQRRAAQDAPVRRAELVTGDK